MLGLKLNHINKRAPGHRHHFNILASAGNHPSGRANPLSDGLIWCTVYPKKYAHDFCFAVLCCGYTLTDFPISIRLTSLALWQSNDCPSASKATLMNMDNTSCEFIMNDCITTTKQSTTKPCAYFLGYTVHKDVSFVWCHPARKTILNA